MKLDFSEFTEKDERYFPKYQNFGAYLKACWTLFFLKFDKTKSVKAQLNKRNNTKDGQLKKALSWYDVYFVAVGAIIGAGLFVLTGEIAKLTTGSGVIVAYVLSGVVAVIAACIYIEFAVELPIAGGAFNYTNLVFGECAGWLVATALTLEYSLSVASVGRGFSAYFSQLINQDTNIFQVETRNPNVIIDYLALIVIILLSIILCSGVRQSSLFNIVMDCIKLIIDIFIIILGLVYFDKRRIRDSGNPDKATWPDGFFPYGYESIFKGASSVFFSYIGFDNACLMAEEVKNPNFDIPVGVLGAAITCMTIYVLATVVIAGGVPYSLIDESAAFSRMFQTLGNKWAPFIIAFGAVCGILTACLNPMMGQARIYVVLGRERLLPGIFAKINKKTKTPIFSQIITMVTAGILALILEIGILSDLVSVGTLFAFAVLALAIMVRKYHKRGTRKDNPIKFWLFVAHFTLYCSVSVIGCFLFFADPYNFKWWCPFLGLWALFTGLMYVYPVQHRPKSFKCPLNPLIPSIGFLANCLLVVAQGPTGYTRFVVFTACCLVLYILYGVHMSDATVLNINNSDDDDVYAQKDKAKEQFNQDEKNQQQTIPTAPESQQNLNGDQKITESPANIEAQTKV